MSLFRASATSGFTLAEMILVVTVMAILASVSASPLYQLIKQRDIREEQNLQIEIQKAMQSHVTNTSELPTDTIATSVTDPANWFNALARYTNLSPNQIRFDVWGNERRYVLLQRTETLLGSDIPVYYATLISAGPDNVAASATSIAIQNGGVFTYNTVAGGNINGYQAASNGNWWKALSNPVDKFSSIAPGGDDMLVRFTDYPDKITRYNNTLERLDRIASALETYSKSKYAEAVVANDANAEKLIYYPYSITGANAAAPDSSGNYSARVKNDVITANNGTGDGSLAMSDTDSTRYTSMILLMRVLGLPDNNCCSALASFVDSGGTRHEMPFFYASNPRPRNADGSCSTRPTPLGASNNVTLPARISVLASTVAGTCY